MFSQIFQDLVKIMNNTLEYKEKFHRFRLENEKYFPDFYKIHRKVYLKEKI